MSHELAGMERRWVIQRLQINMSITGYYFKKYESRDVAKRKAEQIVTLLNQMVKDFITATDERGE